MSNIKAWQAGLRQVKDIINEDGSFCAYSELQGKIDFLEYYRLCDSISIVWKRIIRNDTTLGNPPRQYLAEILTVEKAANMIYTELINDFYIAESTKDKWEILLAEPINMVQFHRHFKNIYIVTNISKLRSFQYLLLHWAVITSKMLHKWKVIRVTFM